MQLELTAACDEPYEFSLRRVQLKSVEAHPTGDATKAYCNTLLQLVDVSWSAGTVNLGVIGVEVWKQLVTHDDVLEIQEEQDWAKY